MVSIIDMKLMRYINLFSRVSRVSTTKCFVYNNQIFFAVPESRMSMAIGKNASNVRKLKEILRRPIRIIVMPYLENKEEIAKFVGDVVEPIELNNVEVKDNSVTITTGRQNKAMLIGRNRLREKELSDVLKNFFHITNFRIA